MQKRLLNICLCLFSLWLLGCQAESDLSTTHSTKRHLYFFETGGMGGKGWEIWVDKLIINERLRIPGGGFSGGTPDPNERLPGGASAAMGETPLPRSVYAYWFSFRLQQFFDVSVTIPDEQQRAIEKLLNEFPSRQYSHTLITGVSGKGGIQFWWEVLCLKNGCPKNDQGRSTFKYIQRLTPWVAATPTEGDADDFLPITLSRIEEGTLPKEIAYQLAYTYGLGITNTSNTPIIAEPMTVTSDTMDLETGAGTGTITYQGEQKLYLLEPGQPNQYSTPLQLMRLPHAVRVEWLNLVTQTNYAKTFNITQAQREQLFALILKYSEKDYRHSLLATVEEHGQVQLEWQVQCLEPDTCPEPDADGHRFVLEPNTQADKRWQNTDKHLEVTRSLIVSGQLPNSVSKRVEEERQ